MDILSVKETTDACVEISQNSPPTGGNSEELNKQPESSVREVTELHTARSSGSRAAAVRGPRKTSSLFQNDSGRRIRQGRSVA